MKIAIRKLGNSAGLILPATLLREMKLSIGETVTAEHVDGALVLKPAAKKRYTVAELVAQCDLTAPVPADMAAWERMEPVGKELL